MLHLHGGENAREVEDTPLPRQTGHLLLQPGGDEKPGPGLQGGLRLGSAPHRACSQEEAAFP